MYLIGFSRHLCPLHPLLGHHPLPHGKIFVLPGMQNFLQSNAGEISTPHPFFIALPLLSSPSPHLRLPFLNVVLEYFLIGFDLSWLPLSPTQFFKSLLFSLSHILSSNSVWKLGWTLVTMQQDCARNFKKGSCKGRIPYFRIKYNFILTTAFYCFRFMGT